MRSPQISEPTYLTKREIIILQLVGKGLSSKDIAELLRLSKETINTHRKQICRKLQLHSTAELIVYAIKHHPASS
jgi:DNA-binding NarL/FixJ family response regulator